jgi:hypothetical protein
MSPLRAIVVGRVIKAPEDPQRLLNTLRSSSPSLLTAFRQCVVTFSSEVRFGCLSQAAQ